MMTVAEAELVRRAAEKGRSASFCAPSQPLSALHSAHSSSSDINMDARAHAAAFLQAQQQASSSPRARLKSSSSARRSQSCKVQGSRPPRIRRRESPRGSDLAIQLDEVANAAFARCAAEQQLEDASYNPFLRKVPSCGRLVTLAPDGGASGEDAEGSPVLRRTASARRPARPQNGSSPNHSPTPTRVVRPSQKSRSTKRPNANASSGSRRSGGGGGGGGTSYLDVKPSGSNEGLDDSYLLRSFATTTKVANAILSQSTLADHKPYLRDVMSYQSILTYSSKECAVSAIGNKCVVLMPIRHMNDCWTLVICSKYRNTKIMQCTLLYPHLWLETSVNCLHIDLPGDKEK
ncbi:uncharacterized protein [Palaemon carinicauda]|uniref:uncharacterized protein n=1 Tax=Palaemon carinicauda TaxID=392227 RepID=UPI0035B683EC